MTSSSQQQRIDYDHPPLVEVVLGIQFHDLVMMNAAHFGWYWHQCLAPLGWQPPGIVEAVDGLRDRVGDEAGFAFPAFRIEFGPSPGRLQSRSSDGTMMMQAQRSRFILNWLRPPQVLGYPRWDTLFSTFDGLFQGFVQFVATSGLPALRVHQWEVVYVNHIHRGTVWNDASDFPRVFPGLFSLDGQHALGTPSVACRSSYELTSGRGRLDIEASRKARLGKPDEQMLHLQLTARGAVKDEVGWYYVDGLQLGHQSIVQAFDRLASDEAKRSWGRR